jgi:hypothetical protein
LLAGLAAAGKRGIIVRRRGAVFGCFGIDGRKIEAYAVWGSWGSSPWIRGAGAGVTGVDYDVLVFVF